MPIIVSCKRISNRTLTKQDFQQHILEHDIPTRAKDFGQKPLEQVDTAGGAIIRVLHGINNNSIVELLILEFHTDGSVKGEFFRRFRGYAKPRSLLHTEREFTLNESNTITPLIKESGFWKSDNQIAVYDGTGANYWIVEGKKSTNEIIRMRSQGKEPENSARLLGKSVYRLLKVDELTPFEALKLAE